MESSGRPQLRSTEGKKSHAQNRKAEIERLRQESKMLENELDRLLLQRRFQEKGAVPPFSQRRSRPQQATRKFVAVDGYITIAPRKTKKHSAWKGIAKRQWDELLKAQYRNQELRASLEVEFVVRRELETVLAHYSPPKLDTSRCNIVAMMSDEDISKELVIRAENGLLELDDILRESPFADPNEYFFDSSVMKRNNLDEFVVFANMTLPFGVSLCAKTIWKILSSDAVKHSCYYHRVVQKSNSTVSYAFGARLSESGVDVDLRGNYSVCLFKDRERYVIVLMGIFVPKQLNGIECQGIVCRQCGWIVLTENGLCYTQSTLSRSHCRFTVDMNVSNEGLLANLCRSVAKSIHEVISSRVATIMEKLLVEEDWKLNGRLEGIVV
ncbi:hypothetical protein DVH05_000630 [Phytophthora capsici]|nr:hypothetical protein DVH05_000630 [Phytophthora capsici]